MNGVYGETRHVSIVCDDIALNTKIIAASLNIVSCTVQNGVSYMIILVFPRQNKTKQHTHRSLSVESGETRVPGQERSDILLTSRPLSLR